ncbi:MAG TPA: Hsp20/alpha crystallin family protein [Deltaproteobacteria bacterium]|jgi:HSP20 family protein|nr:Hsp20/alpha crystallin family protein [Deltaproteobacteria bacterium]HQJ09629.1 Hsp20/alpha crystallin family protein [Deltaproteobacteria bacterium]
MYNLKFQEVMGFLLGPESTEERLGVCYPSLDVYENANELCIEVELPGVSQEEMNVEVVGRTLIISGMKRDNLVNKGVRFIRMERGFGKFRRELDIPDLFDLEKVDARFSDGVLTIRIARSENKAKLIKRITIE